MSGLLHAFDISRLALSLFGSVENFVAISNDLCNWMLGLLDIRVHVKASKLRVGSQVGSNPRYPMYRN